MRSRRLDPAGPTFLRSHADGRDRSLTTARDRALSSAKGGKWTRAYPTRSLSLSLSLSLSFTGHPTFPVRFNIALSSRVFSLALLRRC